MVRNNTEKNETASRDEESASHALHAPIAHKGSNSLGGIGGTVVGDYEFFFHLDFNYLVKWWSEN
jgi:hypothetical protein